MVWSGGFEPPWVVSKTVPFPAVKLLLGALPVCSRPQICLYFVIASKHPWNH